MSSTNLALKKPALPPDSLVLVTGANGFIAAHICDQLLLAGYRVRGTVRNIERNAWLLSLFSSRYGPNRFSQVEVVDVGKSGALDEAVRGVDGVIHVAADTSLNTDAKRVIEGAVDGALGALKSATKEASVKRFVYTSSSTAVYMPGPMGAPYQKITQEVYNDSVVAYVNSLISPSPLGKVENPTPGVGDGYLVYAAAKTAAEKAVWKWVEEDKPDFIVNSVVPSFTIGAPVDPTKLSTSQSGIVAFFQHAQGLPCDEKILKIVSEIPPKYSCDVRDVARAHVAALLASDVDKERLFVFSEKFSRNRLLEIWKEEYPEKKFMDNLEGVGWDESDASTTTKRTVEILEKLGYESGILGLRESLRDALIALV